MLFFYNVIRINNIINTIIFMFPKSTHRFVFFATFTYYTRFFDFHQISIDTVRMFTGRQMSVKIGFERAFKVTVFAYKYLLVFLRKIYFLVFHSRIIFPNISFFLDIILKNKYYNICQHIWSCIFLHRFINNNYLCDIFNNLRNIVSLFFTCAS
jgi:hypothetical protein